MPRWPPPRPGVNPLLLALCSILVGLQFSLPRAWAFLPLFAAACHTPYTPFAGGMTVARLVIVAGLLRAATKGWLTWSPKHPLDPWVAAFAGMTLLSTIGHGWETGNPLTARMRLALDVAGTYLMMRAYLADPDALRRLGIGITGVLLPFAAMMLLERQTGMNPYAAAGAGNLYSLVRDGQIRAQGPFGTPILAGTVGASSIPLLLPLLKHHKCLAWSGIAACFAVVYSSASSGPIGTTAIGLATAALWRQHARRRTITAATCALLVVLHFIKERPVWYLMALLDLVGGSTGWHRAYLIDTALAHFDEWWLLGTDRTRHWMPYGLAAVPEHCDLTNYYVQLGVTGGIGLTALLGVVLWKSFKRVGLELDQCTENQPERCFASWCIGATLLAHALTFLSISYFDQIHVFFWGLVGGLTGMLTRRGPEADPGYDEIPEKPASPAPAATPLLWGRGLAKPTGRTTPPDETP
jgi:hypothetical protein